MWLIVVLLLPLTLASSHLYNNTYDIPIVIETVLRSAFNATDQHIHSIRTKYTEHATLFKVMLSFTRIAKTNTNFCPFRDQLAFVPDLALVKRIERMLSDSVNLVVSGHTPTTFLCDSHNVQLSPFERCMEAIQCHLKTLFDSSKKNAAISTYHLDSTVDACKLLVDMLELVADCMAGGGEQRQLLCRNLEAVFELRFSVEMAAFAKRLSHRRRITGNSKGSPGAAQSPSRIAVRVEQIYWTAGMCVKRLKEALNTSGLGFVNAGFLQDMSVERAKKFIVEFNECRILMDTTKTAIDAIKTLPKCSSAVIDCLLDPLLDTHIRTSLGGTLPGHIYSSHWDHGEERLVKRLGPMEEFGMFDSAAYCRNPVFPFPSFLTTAFQKHLSWSFKFLKHWRSLEGWLMICVASCLEAVDAADAVGGGAFVLWDNQNQLLTQICKLTESQTDYIKARLLTSTIISLTHSRLRMEKQMARHQAIPTRFISNCGRQSTDRFFELNTLRVAHVKIHTGHVDRRLVDGSVRFYREFRVWRGFDAVVNTDVNTQEDRLIRSILSPILLA